MIGEITFTDLSPDQWDHIWHNMRAADRREAEVTGYDDSNYRTLIDIGIWTCCLLDGVPAAAFGYTVQPYTIYFFFVGTPVVNAFGKTLTRFSEGFINARSAEHPWLIPMIGVDPDNRVARRWLKRLGFIESGAYFRTPKGRLLLVERR
jgi:hypothetical protein